MSLYQSIPIHGHDQIRLLAVEAASSADDSIDCKLHVYSLNTLPLYEALSYTWGPPFESMTLEDQNIYVNDHATVVQGNLYNALRRFRLSDAQRLLWIDAVCIDQDNIPERNQQVALMASIYAKAYRVLIWFGEDSITRDGSTSFEVIRSMASLSQWDLVQTIMEVRQGSLTHDGHHMEILMKLLLAGQSDQTINDRTAQIRHYITCLRHFFTRRYFTRMWIIQEIFHARMAIMFCGQAEIPWQTFQRGMDQLKQAGTSALLSGLRGQRSLEALAGSLLERIAQLTQRIRRPKQGSFVLTCIALCHGANCTDPRDKIYALLSLTPDPWLMPDYSLSTTELYAKFTQRCIEQGCAQSVLYTAAEQQKHGVQHRLRRELSPALPSWAVDWRQVHPPTGGYRSFWEDREAALAYDLKAGIIDDSIIECELAVLADVSSSGVVQCNLREVKRHLLAPESLVLIDWLLQRLPVCLMPGDIVCIGVASESQINLLHLRRMSIAKYGPDIVTARDSYELVGAESDSERPSLGLSYSDPARMMVVLSHIERRRIRIE